MNENKKTVKARVGKGFLSKVTRLFDASDDTILRELIQNARRAGATEVNITTTQEPGNPPATSITIADNGRGIEDLTQLLSLSDSYWEEPTLSDEDPAGMGLFCLANLQSESIITSGRGTVVLTADVFAGRQEAVLVEHDTIPGTQVTFVLPGTTHPYRIREAVRWANLPKVTLNGEVIPSSEYVTEADSHVTDPELGVRIRASAGVGAGHRVKANFHGILVPGDVPLNEATWLNEALKASGLSLEVEILHTRIVQMVLPARNALMSGEGLNRLWDSCEKAIYLYYQKQGNHRLPFRLWKRAQSLGILLPEVDLHTRLTMLPGFYAPGGQAALEEFRKNRIILVKDGDWFTASMLSEYFQDEPGLLLAVPKSSYEGYPAYDALLKTRMVLSADNYPDLEDYLKDHHEGDMYRLEVTGLRVSLEGSDVEPAELPFALVSQETPCNDFDYLDTVLIAEPGFREIHDLVSYAVEHWFHESDDWESEGRDEQERQFEEAAKDHFMTLCCSAEEALEDLITSRIRTDVREKMLYGSLKGKTLLMRVQEDVEGSLRFDFSYE